MVLQTVVFSSGSHSLRAGYSSQTFPLTIPSAVVNQQGSYTCGDEAILQDATDIQRPIVGGNVVSWDHLEKLWEYAFRRLQVTPISSGMLLTEPALAAVHNRTTSLEILFEKHSFLRCGIALESLCALCSQGLKSGLVVDSGESFTSVVPIYDGYILKHLVRRTEIAGKTVTSHLAKLLAHRTDNSDIKGIAIHHCQGIKESRCMVSVDRAKDLRLAAETRYFEEQYVLPDGGAVYLGQEKFSTTEALFDPLLVGSDSPGVTDLVFKVIQETDLNLRSEFYQNILLTGANTMFPGLRARLDHELQAKYVDSILKGDKGRYQPGKICVHGPPHRSSSVFIGACVLAEATAAVNESWVTKQEYEDLGAGRCVAKICKA